MNPTVAMRVRQIEAGYGSTRVLRGVDASFDAGTITAVMGRNGVGKSTLMKVLSGHLAAWKGTVEMGGGDISRHTPQSRHALGLAYSAQERPVFDTLSVQDNLALGTASGALKPYEPFFERFPILARRLKQHAGTLSGGEKKILAFARCLAQRAPLSLLDEPSEGVQWENILHMADLLKVHAEQGMAFVVVEQNLEFAERMADHYLMMDHGEIVLTGSPSDLDRDSLLSHLHV